ncbi:FUSC family protein [Streptomyces sp. Vc74B-19]|uniref:FUSC family protein n=1 Tax=unclassified Streptomyces TaxID=2593676 RepID=UPI0027DFF6C3|nr:MULTISPECIES: FUSC family protein [unclassified Streptomyces]MBT3161988.1 FUSC family protein [Streptomyces sp. Vc74B-19]
MTRAAPAVPPWLAHALRSQRGPVSWSALLRGALSGGPLLLAAVLAGRPTLGVVAAIGAMFAGINDRPGSRRASVARIGTPALAGAAGLLTGTLAGDHAPAVPLTLLLTALALLAGGISALGPVGSSVGTQLLVGAAVGAGMPLPEPGWLRASAFVAGAGWLLLLRLALPTSHSLAGDLRSGLRFDGERAAVAGVYEAIAALLDAAGSDRATVRRAALTAALDQAQDALAGPRLRRHPSSAAERRLHAQYAAALPLAEAATALAWAQEEVPDRASEGPRRLAAAVRNGAPTGPLPAPSRHAPGLRALDDALLYAAEAFDRADGGRLHGRRRPRAAVLRTVLGARGREYGMRVALCFGVSAAVAQALYHARWYGQHEHWYWLPATAVFLVKPDLGPLASRVLSRAAGTVLGALLFAGLAAVLPRPGGLVAVVTVCGALIPLATRHFAAQTAVVTVLVLALVMAGGEPQASLARIGETLLACAIVLVVGHLPTPGRRGDAIRARLTEASGAAQQYLAHVLGESEDREARWALRREAYRTLAEARAAIALASAELPPLARHADGADEIATTLELLVDTTTACAVHLDDTGRLDPHHLDRLATLQNHLPHLVHLAPQAHPEPNHSPNAPRTPLRGAGNCATNPHEPAPASPAPGGASPVTAPSPPAETP